LNAAIEAEKAGEYGRGFGVVATEIRRLADQTAVATLDIEHMIRGVQGAISSGVMDMDKFTVDVREGAEAAREVVEQLGEIVARVQAMSTSFEQVNYGMKSQALGAEQITESVRQLGDAAAQSAASIRDINAVINNLCEATQGLADAIVTQRRESLESLTSLR
jgi:methyl-accepting chemotaxis protein WspA